MTRLCAAAALLLAPTLVRPAAAARPPSVSDFAGTWRIAAVVGASDGGVTGADPKILLGKVVRWTPTEIRSPEGQCRLRDPAVAPVANRMLETSFWGGQPIAELKLSRTDLAKAFGAQQTPVFQDKAGCAHAVLIDGDHMVDAFGSGWIYRLDRAE